MKKSENSGLFRHQDLANGFAVHLHRTRAFKTISARLVFHANLDDETAARALVPRVLGRGTRRYPSLRSFQTVLDRLYGAHLSGDARKIGERQLIAFRADWVTDRLSGEPLLSKMGELWAELLHDPARGDRGGLRTEVIEQERGMQADEAAAIFDDKARYARQRLIEEMCEGEPFARPAHGRVEEIRAVEPDDVERAWKETVDHAPADLYLVGDLSWTQAVRFAKGLGLNGARNPKRVRATRRGRAGDVRTVRERQDVGQGKLEMGFRCSIGLSHALYPGLVLFNVLFGGSPVGKLFKKVREEASLCYSISSGLERTKGLLLVQAGIEIPHYAKARRLVLLQLDELKAGNIEPDEFARAKGILLSSVRSMCDSPGALTEFALERRINGVDDDFARLQKALERVTAADVKKAARRIHLDTVYFLRD